MPKKSLNPSQAARYRYLQTAAAALHGESRELSDMQNRCVKRRQELVESRARIERAPNMPGASEQLKHIEAELQGVAANQAELSRLQAALGPRVQRLAALRTRVDEWLRANNFSIPGDPIEPLISTAAHREFRMHDQMRAQANQRS